MGILRLPYQTEEGADSARLPTLAPEDYAKFNAQILGLGDVSQKSDYTGALAAVFDLEGFTAFCNQIDPHLTVPEFLELFLNWLFKEISDEFKKEDHDGRVVCWAPLPFFAKFMGDGVLLLWDTQNAKDEEDVGNIVVSTLLICERYKSSFLPSVRADFNRLPPGLRCGIARGQVIAVGNGADFVGSCINMASRLQKLPGLSFALPRRGFNPKKCFSLKYQKKFTAKRIAIRGVGEDEVVLILQDEFITLSEDDKKLYISP